MKQELRKIKNFCKTSSQMKAFNQLISTFANKITGSHILTKDLEVSLDEGGKFITLPSGTKITVIKYVNTDSGESPFITFSGDSVESTLGATNKAIVYKNLIEYI